MSLRRGVVTAVAHAERYFAENTLPQQGRTHD
jgi:hypothetical protein